MKCPACGGFETKPITEVDDAGDVERIVCANEECNYIHSSEVIVERADGSKMRRPQRISPEEQPVSFDFAAKGGGVIKPEDKIMSAEEMLELAIRTREETIGKAAKDIVRDILAACAENVLDGEYEYLITEDNAPPGEVFSLVLKELRAKGYRVKKTPSPGEGTWIQVKWPTTRKGRKKTNQKSAPESGGDGDLQGEESTLKEGNIIEPGADTETESSGSSPEEGVASPLKVTRLAIEKIKDISSAEGLSDSRLRVKVVGGGCAGFSYDMAFDEKIIEGEDGETITVPAQAGDPVKAGDRKFVIDGVTVVVDEMSLMYIYGTVIDYVDTLQGTGFKFDNPNVKNTCGCGSSFQV